MVTTDSTRKSNRVSAQIRIALAACFVAISCSGLAAEQDTEFHGGIQVGVLHTDNLYLVPPPGEIDQTIYQVSPSLSLDYGSPRVDLNLRYRFDWYDYSDLDTSQNSQRYDVKLTADLVRDTFFLDAGGSQSQSLVDPNFVIPPDSLPISGNLADRNNYFIGPRFEKTFGSAITVRGKYKYEDVNYDESSFGVNSFIQDNTNETADFEMENYQKGRGLTWAARYEWNKTDYDVSIPYEYRKASIELGFWASGKVRVFASGGEESAWDDPIDRSLQDPFWEAGFAYKDGDRINAEFAAGKRSFGSSWRGSIALNYRRGDLRFTYAQTPTTTGMDGYDLGNLLNPETPRDILTQPGSAERYISERGEASAHLDLRRTTIGFVIFDENRTHRFRADGTPLEDESQDGVSVWFAWQLGARTELVAAGSINHSDTVAVGSQEFRTGSIKANYRFGRRLGMSLGYAYTTQDPQQGSTGPDYTAGVSSLFLTYEF